MIGWAMFFTTVPASATTISPSASPGVLPPLENIIRIPATLPNTDKAPSVLVFSGSPDTEVPAFEIWIEVEKVPEPFLNAPTSREWRKWEGPLTVVAGTATAATKVPPTGSVYVRVTTAGSAGSRILVGLL